MESSSSSRDGTMKLWWIGSPLSITIYLEFFYLLLRSLFIFLKLLIKACLSFVEHVQLFLFHYNLSFLSFVQCFEEEGSMRPFWRGKWKKNGIEEWQPKAKKHWIGLSIVIKMYILKFKKECLLGIVLGYRKA